MPSPDSFNNANSKLNNSLESHLQSLEVMVGRLATINERVASKVERIYGTSASNKAEPAALKAVAPSSLHQRMEEVISQLDQQLQTLNISLDRLDGFI